MIMAMIFVALDYSTQEKAIDFAGSLIGQDVGVTSGKELFTSAGPDVVNWFVRRRFKVFLDLKYHDIPNIVAGAILAASELGVYMVNVHCSGGPKMMRAAAQAARDHEARKGTRPLVVGVTI